MKQILALSTALLVLAAFAAPSTAAVTYTLTVKADASSYSGAQPLIASGAVSPPPGSGTAVFLKIIGPSGGSPLSVGSANVNGSTGSYQYRFVLGGSSSWVAGTYTVAASWGNSPSGTVNATTTFAYAPATTTTTTTTSTRALPPGAHVIILNGASSNLNSPGFSPATTTVVIGVNNTVTWLNNDTATHTATAADGSFNSGDIAPHATWSYTFTAAGTFNYYCVYHGWMKGTVIVKAAGGSTSSTTSSSTTTSTTTPSTSSTTTTTGTTTVPSTSSTTSTTSTTITPSTTASSSTSSGGGGIPEFPFQLLGVSALTALVVASYLLARRRQISGGLVGRSSA